MQNWEICFRTLVSKQPISNVSVLKQCFSVEMNNFNQALLRKYNVLLYMLIIHPGNGNSGNQGGNNNQGNNNNQAGGNSEQGVYITLIR